MIGIIDYGAGNMMSISKALDYLRVPWQFITKPGMCEACEKLILPGVGAFPAAMRALDESGLTGEIKEQAENKPLLGVCLGMQMLFEQSSEFGRCAGLGLIPGTVEKIIAGGLRIPHMGWNELKVLHETPLLTKSGGYMYFVHSYRAVCDDQYIAAYTEYGKKIPALVYKGNVYGAQFHPEKSSAGGMALLKAFAAI